MDLYALDGASIRAGETVLVHTGIALAIPEGYAGFIYARSGIATKRGLAPANKVGVVDADYRGEIMVALHNHGEKTETVDAGERVAQMVVAPFLLPELVLSESLDETARADGGFGSTGKK
jgi:dUTP pyrophosphatase